MASRYKRGLSLLKITLFATLCIGMSEPAEAQRRGKTITAADQDMITASAKQTLRDLMKLIDFVSDSTHEQSERDYGINEAFNGQEYIFTKSAKIEDDSDPNTHSSSGSTPTDFDGYLRNLSFLFKRWDTTSFAPFDISCVKQGKDGRKYIIVPFSQTLSGASKGVRYKKNLRVADMTAVPIGKKQWKTVITYVGFYDPAKISSLDCIEKGEDDTATADAGNKPEAYYTYMLQKGDRQMANSKFTDAYFSFMEAKKDQRHFDEANQRIKLLSDKMRKSDIQGVHEYWSNQLTVKGKELESEHRYEQALQYYNYAWELNPTSTALPKIVDAVKDKAILKRQLAANFDKKLYDQGVGEYTTAIKNDPENSDLYVERAKCYWMLGLDQQAKLDFNTAIKLNASIDISNVLVYLWRGRYFETKNNAAYFDSAYACFVNYISKSEDKDDPLLADIYSEATYCKAMNLYKKNKYSEAIDSFNSAISKNDKFKEAYCYLGCCYLETKNNEKAIENLKKAIELDPNYPDAHYWYGRALRQKDWSKYSKEALNEMGTAIVLNDKNPNWFTWNAEIADILKRIANYEDAIKHYNNCIRANSEKYAPYYLLTGECYHLMKQNDRAREEYGKYKGWCEKNSIAPDKDYQVRMDELGK